jgi:hypothetical protein
VRHRRGYVWAKLVNDLAPTGMPKGALKADYSLARISGKGNHRFQVQQENSQLAKSWRAWSDRMMKHKSRITRRECINGAATDVEAPLILPATIVGIPPAGFASLLCDKP